jgi:hypothetical protein
MRSLTKVRGRSHAAAPASAPTGSTRRQKQHPRQPHPTLNYARGALLTVILRGSMLGRREDASGRSTAARPQLSMRSGTAVNWRGDRGGPGVRRRSSDGRVGLCSRASLRWHRRVGAELDGGDEERARSTDSRCGERPARRSRGGLARGHTRRPVCSALLSTGLQAAESRPSGGGLCDSRVHGPWRGA